MKKLRIFVLFAIFMVIATCAKKLTGEDFKDSVDLLLYALDQLSTKNNITLTAGDINSASSLLDRDGYQYEAVLLDDKNKEHNCIIEIASIGNKDSKIQIKCSVMHDIEAIFN